MKGITQMSKTTIDMAREAGFDLDGMLYTVRGNHAQLAHLEALVRADEQEKYKWDIHSCGPTCKRYACVAMREAVEAEREACAKVCDDAYAEYPEENQDYAFALAAQQLATTIRARGNT
jgi:hypothetical protein